MMAGRGPEARGFLTGGTSGEDAGEEDKIMGRAEGMGIGTAALDDDPAAGEVRAVSRGADLCVRTSTLCL
jgi:hypothetical protein